MRAIIKIKNSSYKRYEELLIQKETFEKEAHHYLVLYIHEFGELIAKIFQLKIECIRQKKAIALCQAALNRGNFPDLESIKNKLDKRMAKYYEELAEMVKNNALYKNLVYVPEAKLIKIKTIYRKIVKILHPDINPHTNKSKELKELWERANIAYRANDLEEIENVLILTKKAMENAGLGIIEVDIPNISDKITEIEEKIATIVNNDPYRYKELINDKLAVEEKKLNLKNELKDFKKYKKELDDVLNNMLGKEASKLSWTIN